MYLSHSLMRSRLLLCGAMACELDDRLAVEALWTMSMDCKRVWAVSPVVCTEESKSGCEEG